VAAAITPQKARPPVETNPNQLQAICVDMLKAANSDTNLEFFDSFEQDLAGININTSGGVNVPLAAQENSHLLKLETCLLGCVFYIGLNECLFTKDSIDNWKAVIEKFAGRCVDSYDEHKEEITHVLSPIRVGEVYKKVGFEIEFLFPN
jgi:hypothetical protein